MTEVMWNELRIFKLFDLSGKQHWMQCLAAITCWLILFPVFANGQEAEQPSGLIALSEVSDTDRLILKSLRESDPKSPVDLVRAIKVTLDVRQFRDSKFYLKKLSDLGLNDRQMFDLNEEVGSDFFFLIHRVAELQPEGRELAKKVLAASRSVAVSPTRLDSLIERLNDSDILVRSEAYRQLKVLGEPAVAKLLNTFADEKKKKLFPGIRGAIRHMGEASQGPLLGGARAGDLQVQVESIRALAYYKTPEAVDVMMRAYLSPKAPEHTRRLALSYLADRDRQVDSDMVERRLYERSMGYLLGKRQIAGALIGDVKVWDWNPEANKVTARVVSVDTAKRILASRQANDLYEIRPELPRNRELYLLTKLESAKRSIGSSRRVNVPGLVNGLQLRPNEAEKTLARALELDLIPAAIACCEILGQTGNTGFLQGVGSGQRPLIRAILSGDRHLQFAALDAINRIDPKTPYPGSSYMTSLAVFLAQSENLPAGLVGHQNAETAQSYASNFSAGGLVGNSATSSREFFKAATSDPDLEVLVVSDTLDRPDYAELVQQLRLDWRTRRLPIALMFVDQGRSRRASIRIGDDPRFMSVPFANDPLQVASHVRQLKSLVDTSWTITNFERRKHAAAAVDWLRKISSDRDSYAFYDLGSHEAKLARLLYVPGFAPDASRILANLGTPLAQRELANYASQGAVPLEDRRKVAQAFIDSVLKSGAMLTTREIQLQYDRYNSSENEPRSSQQILASMLDAIESRRDRAN